MLELHRNGKAFMQSIECVMAIQIAPTQIFSDFPRDMSTADTYVRTQISIQCNKLKHLIIIKAVKGR